MRAFVDKSDVLNIYFFATAHKKNLPPMNLSGQNEIIKIGRLIRNYTVLSVVTNSTGGRIMSLVM